MPILVICLVQDLTFEADLASHYLGAFGHFCGRQDIGRLVGQIAREIHRFADDLARLMPVFRSLAFAPSMHTTSVSTALSFLSFVLYLSSSN